MVNYDCACLDLTCDTFALPAITFAACLTAFGQELSQICELLVSVEDDENPGEPLYVPTDIASASAWLTAFTTTGAGIRRLIGIGSIPKPEREQREVSKGRVITGDGKYTLTFTIDEMNQSIYDFLRGLQCGATLVIWYVTKGGFLYGGEKGFSVQLIEADPIWDGDTNSYLRGELVVTWNRRCAPPRSEYPLSEAGNPEEEVEGP